MMNIMKRNYLFLATAIIALASCSENTYLGDQEGAATGSGAISFGSNLPTLTRAEGATAAQALGNKFQVYATKTVTNSENTDVISNVFATNQYSTEENYSAEPYWVWYQANSANGTASNTKGWEYVGTGGTVISPALSTAQTIKYWDYSAKKYEFVAYSATVKDGTSPYSITKYNKDGFTITATAAELAGLYVADKITLTAGTSTSSPGDTDYNPNKPATVYNKIGDIVKFTFRSSGAKVRLGIYETINGYVVKNVSFLPYSPADFTAGAGSAKLSGSFNGTSSSANGTYNVTYNSTTGVAEFDNTTESADKYFDFGSFTTDAIGTSSTAPTWAGSSTSPYYQGVLPNTDNTDNMILHVDYDLYNTTTHETIHVTGAKAVVPKMYMTWKPNHAYTYLFKISDNTNGHTGPGTTPEGLYPITFDAVTIATTNDDSEGTITTVSTPAITTYQEGSVSDAGITYASTKGAIYITVNENGTLKVLSADNTKLYTVASGTTEADLILTNKEKTPATGDNALSILNTAETKQDITFAANTTAKFTPAANTTYAVKYLVSAEVTAVYSQVTNGTDLTVGNKYYTSSSGEGEFTATTGQKANDSTYELTTAPKPAVYQYKIIVVGS